ncbi:hypothetical protein CLG96_10400 [Sphingomonas oleivorans]|uniref:Ni/Co efflux regulator RcnB n=1 Tax=Sphingomonas oleivorans TaxID=1735121 RepID=A0A2T5FXE3_9SPHN|nr:RcnB family protein [Sphingomonas oleivorans]PTQ10803.1 hypothetical protein CLG96_10400 [Sphingomonas oleivorans]
MRKLILFGLMAATAIPSLAHAQTRELHEDRRDIRQEQRDVDRAIRYGAPPHVVREEQRDVRRAEREYREDWRDYRRSHREVYRRPAYAGPRGYSYRRVVVGHRFAPVYYAPRYVIADPRRYRLPHPVGANRWVRYGNDAVLVDARTGRVRAVHYGFFW